MADETEKSELDAQIEFLRGLAQIVAETGLSKLEVEQGEVKFTIKAASIASAGATAAPPIAAPGVAVALPAAAPPTAASRAKSDEKLTPLVSPMVGVFYRAPSPSDPNFVEVGDRVERGQTIGLVEAMKVFNEITAESAGVVAKIAVETGQLVETGQALYLLK